MAGGDDRGGLDRPLSVADLDDVSDQIVVDLVPELLCDLLEIPEIVRLDPQLFRRRRADQNGVVPSELGDKIRRLEEPGIIGVAPVVHARTLEENEFEPGGGRLGFCRDRRCGGDRKNKRNLRESGDRQEADAKDIVPKQIGSAGGGNSLAGGEGFQRGPDQFRPIGGRSAEKFGKDIQLGNSAPKRKDHRLDRRVGAVVCPGIPPRFQKVRGRHMPAGQF